MNITKPLIFLAAMGLAAGCATTPSTIGAQNASGADACLDPTRQVREFEVQSDRLLTVNYLGGKTYQVTLRHACPGLNDAEQVSFATGPDQYVGQNRMGAVYATPVEHGRICGRGGERIVLRERFSDFSRPSRGCAIESIERIDEAVYLKIE